jgi:hypothetical protein
MIAKQMEHKKVVEDTRNTFNTLTNFSDNNEDDKNLNVVTSDATNDRKGSEEKCNKYVVQTLEHHSTHLNTSNLIGRRQDLLPIDNNTYTVT